ncbi:MAG: hypothetical protein BWX47_01326 [candidate division Hyd24-12 bacterium ADurb.Bin004]|nr:MAG: hypothetical protein BWX47_01326 [candidate division Hyd24-12 bacterium ADurb.Bin004]
MRNTTERRFMLKHLELLLLMVLLPFGIAQAQEVAPQDATAPAVDSSNPSDSSAVSLDTALEVVPPVEIAPPGAVTVSDFPNDAGDHLLVSFEPSPDEALGILVYRIYRRTPGATDGTEEWAVVKTVAAGDHTGIVDGYDPDYLVTQGTQYEYRVAAVTADCREIPGEVTVAQVVGRGEWFHTEKLKVLIGCIIFISLIFYYFKRAQMCHELYLRPIPGIDAIDEAIGRATEMGKPILYVPGLSGIEDVATIASLTILNRVAKKVAEYQTPLRVPNRDPIVYTVAEESVKQAYMEAGRPDSYEANSVFFVTDSQFAYVAAVNGLMTREKPATNFYLGMFWAESLLLAETGSLSGAIQIAGTDAITQLPFFITTCDYTLIGEELYAASAYLGREPKQVGSVKGQDACKGIVMTLVTVGIILSLVDIFTGGATDPSKSLLLKLQGLVDVTSLE